MQQQSDASTSAMIVVKLEEQDSVKSFDCGDDDLNDFILHESPLYRKEKLAVTYVLKEADDLANEQYKNIRRDITPMPRRFVSVTVSRIVIASPRRQQKIV